MMSFIYDKGKILPQDLTDVSILNVVSGPYIIKVEHDLTGPLYFVGADEGVNQYVRKTGRVCLSLPGLVDSMYDALSASGIEHPGVSEKFGVLKKMLAQGKRLMPDCIQVETNAAPSEVADADPRLARFNKAIQR